MKITAIGLGYIGLPVSVMFAKQDINVVGVDVNSELVETLNTGRINTEEPGLQEAFEEVITKDRFKASLIPEKSDVFIISVPTPSNDDENKSMDPSFVIEAVKSVLPYIEKGNTIIVESTIAPRTTEDLIQPIIENSGLIIGKDVYLVHCPERVLPGNILEELVYNNRIIGGITPACAEAGAQVYKTFVQGKLLKTNANTAEMAKLMENTYRDVNIALANELTKVCNELDINALEVIEMANKHPRVNIHKPGPGVGGHCLAVDPYFIISKAPKTAKLIETSRTINLNMPSYVVENVNKLMKKENGKKITIFGLTYKGNVSDIRESPAIKIFELLKSEGNFEVVAYDPYVDLDWVYQDLEAAVFDSDLVLILSDHNEFKTLDWTRLSKMNNIKVFDTKNVVTNPSNQYINFGNLFQNIRY